MCVCMYVAVVVVPTKYIPWIWLLVALCIFQCYFYNHSDCYCFSFTDISNSLNFVFRSNSFKKKKKIPINELVVGKRCVRLCIKPKFSFKLSILCVIFVSNT